MAEMSNNPILTGLSYVFSHEGGKTVAHCLNLDLVASGANLAEAEACLNTLVLVQIATCFKSGNYAQLKFRAPGSYWKAIDHAKRLESGVLEVEVPPIVLPVDRYTVGLPVARYEMEMELTAA
jgi:hypothetical protein